MSVMARNHGKSEQQRPLPKRKFLHIATVPYRPSIQAKQSVYYWWYAYLKRNERYKRCCESGGKGRLAHLYKDFGDVFTGSFKTWWDEDNRGERLFAEPLAPLHLKELRSVKEWDDEWTRDNVMVVAVPLSEPKRRLKRWFDELLMRRHGGRPGVPAKLQSESLYPVHTTFSVLALEQMLMVYDLKLKEPDLTLAKLGELLKLVPTAMPKKTDGAERATEKRNTMAATVSRYLKKANAYIENTAAGKFPCAD